MTAPPASVIKVGGSILRDSGAYISVARRLAPLVRASPTWVVVSAAYGVTDALQELAGCNPGRPLRELVELHRRCGGAWITPFLEADLRAAFQSAAGGDVGRLLAWGERASVAALHARLAALGVELEVVELNVDTPPVWRPGALVPGFYVRDSSGSEVCLPRGGSDLSAVLTAAALGVREVTFWKSGGGVLRDGWAVPELAARDYLSSPSDPLRPLQADAVRLARRLAIDLVLEDPLHAGGRTRITAGTTNNDPVFPGDSTALPLLREGAWTTALGGFGLGGPVSGRTPSRPSSDSSIPTFR
ncbi:MAG TPA: hypothetical protein VFF67_08480 [Thermoplasmata archaeon]|nr:hypothetical protein [Thermoplasmata archaeon]